MGGVDGGSGELADGGPIGVGEAPSEMKIHKYITTLYNHNVSFNTKTAALIFFVKLLLFNTSHIHTHLQQQFLKTLGIFSFYNVFNSVN